MKLKALLALFIAGMLMISARSAFSTMSTEDVVKRLDELNVIIKRQQDEIERLKKELQRQDNKIHEVREGQQQKIQNAVKEEAKKQKSIRAENIPKWTEKLKLYGDLRLRYEGFYNRTGFEKDGSEKDLPNRNRFRFRYRIFLDADITDEIAVKTMIGSNMDRSLAAPTTNQSLTGDFADKGIYIHRAYALYTPNWLRGLELSFGKFRNTFLHTDIMWDSDVNPEGLYERYQYKGFSAFQPYVHLGQLIVNEKNLETDDATLFIYQAGFDWKIGPLTWVFAGSYYNWRNLENSNFLRYAEYVGGGGNTFVTGPDGELQYAYGYRLWECLSYFKFDLGPIPTKLTFDYIKNVAEDVPDDQDTAYYAGFTLGTAQNRGDWSFLYKYARIERDALVGSLNDQDFYGANRKGHKLALSYKVLKNLRLRTAYFDTRPVSKWDPDSPNWNNEKYRGKEHRLQVDCLLLF